MLIEFSVSNFRSIKDKQTLSMVASADKNEEFSFETGLKSSPRLLRAASIHGTNASGKSNIIRAMHFLKYFVVNSAKNQRGDDINDVMPFMFSEDCRDKPSEFEVIFIDNNKTYQYGFSVDKEKVHEEWLFVTPNGGAKQTAQTWFERTGDDYTYPSAHLKGSKKSWEKATKENVLFLSKAIQENSKDLVDIFDWIRGKFNVLPSNDILSDDMTAEQIIKGDYKAEIINFIKNSDLGISGLSVSEEKASIGYIPDFFPKELKDKIMAENDDVHYGIKTKHVCENGSIVSLDIEEASEGTQIIFNMAYMLLYVLKNSEILVIDELDRSLHPHLLSAIIDMFQDKNINKNNAQLIFTGHETSIMNSFRKDQIWITEKGKYGDTKLVSLSDFKGRNDDDYESRYNSGRYGGIPNLRDLV